MYNLIHFGLHPYYPLFLISISISIYFLFSSCWPNQWPLHSPLVSNQSPPSPSPITGIAAGSKLQLQPLPSGGSPYLAGHQIQTTFIIQPSTLKPPIQITLDHDLLLDVSQRKKPRSCGWRPLKWLTFMTSCIIPPSHLASLPMSPAVMTTAFDQIRITVGAASFNQFVDFNNQLVMKTR